jgi:hypothetical protein
LPGEVVMAARYENRLVTFDADLDAFAKQVGVDLGRVIRRVAVDLHDRIVTRTPVDSGRARASWTMSIDTPQGPGDVGAVKLNAAAAAAQAQATQGVLATLAADPYRQVWIFSNVVYIIALEHGHSKKAPNGMVAISTAEVEAEIDRMLGS